MKKSEAEDLDMFDDVEDMDDNDVIEEFTNSNNIVSAKTARSEIEIKRELLELQRITGEYYGSDIFN